MCIAMMAAIWGCLRRDPQGDGGVRPGDWLVLLIGGTLIIGLALVVLGAICEQPAVHKND